MLSMYPNRSLFGLTKGNPVNYESELKSSLDGNLIPRPILFFISSPLDKLIYSSVSVV